MVFRNHSFTESSSEKVPSTVPEWMNGVINQSILAKLPVLEGPTEKLSTNCKTTQLTPERNVYKAARSTGEKGLILPGWGRGVGAHKGGHSVPGLRGWVRFTQVETG